MLREPQFKYLRGLGHALKPVVVVADKGLSPAVMAEFETALSHHELIKVRLRVGDREQRGAMIASLVAASGAVLVQRIGNVALLYRENPDDKKIRVPAT